MSNAAVQAAIAAAAQQTNMNEGQKGGGGSYEPPAAGLTRLRLVGYIETGKEHDEKYSKTRDKVRLIFELSGPKHKPKEVDGNKIPHRITVFENLSLNEKANFYKLFRAMNYDQSATHMAQLLGKEFLGEVVHFKRADGSTGVSLKKDGVYTVRGPFVEDPETGETRKVPAGEQISETRCFLWDFASKEMWDSIHIEGEYPEEKDEQGKVTRKAKSKNVFQDAIRAAVNFEGSPISEVLEGSALDMGGEDQYTDPGAGDSDPVPEDAGTEEDDPLAGVS